MLATPSPGHAPTPMRRFFACGRASAQSSMCAALNVGSEILSVTTGVAQPPG